MERIKSYDVFKGLCMFFVILSHNTGSWFWSSIYTPFFLSGFFFISGFFFYNPSKLIPISQKVVNIITSIFIPYSIYVFLTTAVLSVFAKDWYFLPEFMIIMLSGTKFWFISVLILTELWACLIYNRLKENMGVWYVCFFISISLLIYFLLSKEKVLPWYYNISFLANAYFGMGILARKYKDRINEFLLNKKIGLISLICYIVLVILDVTYFHQNGSFNTYFSNYPLFFLESFLGIESVLYISHSWLSSFRFLSFIGQYSLLYYLLQYRFTLGAATIFNYLGIGEDLFFSGLIKAVLVIVIMTPIVWLIGRYVPIMSGKYRFNISKR